MNFVYILLLNNNNCYVGQTHNIKNRLAEHQNGKVKSTHGYRPVKLIHYESYALKSDALRREKFLKTTEGKRLLKMQLRDIFKLCGR